jgi:tight adherence protein B
VGTLVGLAFGAGLLTVISAWGRPRRGPRRPDPLTGVLRQAGIDTVTPRQLRRWSGAGGLAVAGLTAALSGVLAVGAVAGIAAARAPRALLVRRARARQGLLREVWPDAVDHLNSAVRAGMSLPEALAALSSDGPEDLRPAFARFAEDVRATGSFSLCLDRLAAALADPTADQVIETVRLARDVGGSDLGGVLRTLSAFLREESRTRAELETRQSWNINAARLALVAPWAVLALLAAGSRSTVDAYNRPGGLVVLCVGSAVSLLAYRLMLAVGRLPDPPRVLRAST